MLLEGREGSSLDVGDGVAHMSRGFGIWAAKPRCPACPMGVAAWVQGCSKSQGDQLVCLAGRA